MAYTLFAKIKKEKQLVKVVDANQVYEGFSLASVIPVSYSAGHHLDEEAWFAVANFSAQPYYPQFLSNQTSPISAALIKREQFDHISWVMAKENGVFLFQKLAPSNFLKKKTILEAAMSAQAAVTLGEDKSRIVLNYYPDAVYVQTGDTLYFRNIVPASYIFKGLDQLHRDATSGEVATFLASPIITLAGGYNVDKVSKPNRKRLAMVMSQVAAMDATARATYVSYIQRYCPNLSLNPAGDSFQIAADSDLRMLIYGLSERFYETEMGRERRLANSVQVL